MQGITGSTLTAEVEKKLDDLFQEEETIEEGKGEQDVEEALGLGNGVQAGESHEGLESQNTAEQSPLASLKSIVLSLDWEITDEAMAEFLKKTEAIRSECEGDQVLKIFVQMLFALGKYIKRHKGDSNPEAVRLLNTTFQSFEKVFEDKGLSETQKKDILDQKVKEFMELKRAIGSKRTVTPAHTKALQVDRTFIRETVQEAVKQAMEDLKEMIREQFESLKDELKTWSDEHGQEH